MTQGSLCEHLSGVTSKDAWAKIGVRKRSGILVPLFSVYSRESAGIGELEDIKLLVRWCASTGNSIIQLLPMNEMGPLSCPYDSISSFALEPVYLTLRSFDTEGTLQKNIKDIKKKFPVGKGFVDYRVRQVKMDVLKEIFCHDNYSPEELNAYRRENHYWLDDFVLYKALKAYHAGRPWYEWHDQYKNRDVAQLQSFWKAHEQEIIFEMWVQLQLFKQFKEIKGYASEHGVLLKGDLPILVSRDSADVWSHPEFFKLEYASGAPPDMYAAKGQRWGMPTYNWENIAFGSYTYLKEKIKYAQNFYDILRVDHVVGLFRIWSIPYNDPLENQGLNGFFDPRDEKVWGPQGRDILSVMVGNTNMLLCAEDLGIIPRVCTETLYSMGIPGNDVQRWVKDWDKAHDFLGPQHFRSLSVAMLSTHDTTTWAAWWENEAGTVDEDLMRRKCSDRGIDFNYVKGRLFDAALSRHGRLRWLKDITCDGLQAVLGKRREEIGDFIELYLNTYQEKEKLWKMLHMPGEMQEKAGSVLLGKVLQLTLKSNAIFCIQLLTDWLGLTKELKGDPYQYRINTPGTISEKNWSLTLPLSLEKLLEHEVNSKIRDLIKDSGR